MCSIYLSVKVFFIDAHQVIEGASTSCDWYVFLCRCQSHHRIHCEQNTEIVSTRNVNVLLYSLIEMFNTLREGGNLEVKLFIKNYE